MRRAKAKVRVRPTELAVRFPVLREIVTVVSANGEGWGIVDIGARRADHCVDVAMYTVGCYYAICSEPEFRVSILIRIKSRLQGPANRSIGVCMNVKLGAVKASR